MSRAALSLTARLFAAAVAAFAPAALAEATGSGVLDRHLSVSVVIDGSLPGFTSDQLSEFVRRQMVATHATNWRFAPADAGATAANRVVWRFKLLPYDGGAVRYIGPAVSRAESLLGVRRAVGIDAKVYLDGQYQSSTFDQASIKGGPKDSDLGEVIQRVMRSAAVNAITMDLPSEGRPRTLKT